MVRLVPVGVCVIVTFADGTARGYNVVRVEQVDRGTRLHVLEDPGIEVTGDGVLRVIHCRFSLFQVSISVVPRTANARCLLSPVLARIGTAACPFRSDFRLDASSKSIRSNNHLNFFVRFQWSASASAISR